MECLLLSAAGLDALTIADSEGCGGCTRLLFLAMRKRLLRYTNYRCGRIGVRVIYEIDLSLERTACEPVERFAWMAVSDAVLIGRSEDWRINGPDTTPGKGHSALGLGEKIDVKGLGHPRIMSSNSAVSCLLLVGQSKRCMYLKTRI